MQTHTKEWLDGDSFAVKQHAHHQIVMCLQTHTREWLDGDRFAVKQHTHISTHHKPTPSVANITHLARKPHPGYIPLLLV